MKNSKKVLFFLYESSMMIVTHHYPDLTPWHPTPTQLPEKWKALADTLAQQAKGSPHPYVLNVRYDAESVGNLLRSWGLPWQVVMAGYLWEHDKEQIQSAHLHEVETVLSHISEANLYVRYIKNENLPPLLTPPYHDLGALLIAVAIYYQALQVLQEQSKGRPYTERTRSQIERVGRALLNITKQLGIWHLKRDSEDLSEQLHSPQKFAEAQQEHRRILAQDAHFLEETRQLLIATYQEAVQGSISVTYTPCGINGMKRRKQDAHTTAKSQKTQLTGFDLVTFDIIVPNVQDCYNAFGVLSQLGQIQDRVTDLIANPKPNGCSHIALGLILKPQFSNTKNFQWTETNTHICQIQIATHFMQAINWHGCLYPRCYPLYEIASLKKEEVPFSVKQAWSSKEGNVLHTIKENLANDRGQPQTGAPIIVFDKSRREVALPKGATALDFAYALDRSVGERTVDAIVNNRKAPLYRPLNSGDIVEVRTSDEIQVQPYWATYTTTAQARRQIQESLNQRSPGPSGYTLLLQELDRYHYILPPETFKEELSHLVKQYNLGTPQKYLERLDPIGELHYTPKWAAQEIMRQVDEQDEMLSISIRRHGWIPKLDMQQATQNKFIHQQRLCRFCQPTYPRDMKIMGRLRKHSGELVVHKESCPHLIDRTVGYQSALLPMIWQPQPPAFQVGFFIIARDRRGLILDLTRQLRRHQCDLLSIDAEVTKFNQACIRFTIETHADKEVIDIWQELYKIDNVTRVEINAAATSIDIRDRLKKLHRKEPPPKKSPLEFLLEEPMEIREPRNVLLHNPFDISRPATAKMFFGRATETEMMQRELCDSERGKALILFGPRRIGKSSICMNFLERHVQPPSWGVFFSLQNAMRQNEETILMQLADKVCCGFSEQLQQPAPSWQHYSDSDPQVRFRRLLQDCISLIPGTRLILTLDEFGGAIQSYQQRILEYRFFTFCKELMSEIAQLSLILVLPMSSHSLLTSRKFVNVFSFAQQLPVMFLDRNSAQQLLVDPLREQNIEIHPNTIALALKLTGGNPYYMTLIGQQLIHYLNREIHQQLVTDTDLRLAIEQIIEKGSSQHFDFLRSELQNYNEFSILEAIVELTIHTKQTKVQLKKVAAALDLPIPTIRRHLDRLRIGLILDENGPISNPYYSFKIDLVRRWLTRNRWFFSSLKDKHA